VADRYADFTALAQVEREGHDFRILTLERPSRFIVLAPHGGNIEPGTSEIAQAWAAHDHACYVFEGLKYTGNAALHITSSHFDEPRCLALLPHCQTAITVHGESSETEHVFLGGLDTGLRGHLADALRVGGFSVAVHANPKMQGVHPRNICNRAASGRGVQLEIARGLRETFFTSMTEHGRQFPTARLADFVRTVRQALAMAQANEPAQLPPCLQPQEPDHPAQQQSSAPGLAPFGAQMQS
jgi:phage replication-related protein YjqB (UPF0714/DUF867 family)